MTYPEIAAQGEAAYVAEQHAKDVARVEADRADAAAKGRLGYVHFTTKSVKVTDLWKVA